MKSLICIVGAATLSVLATTTHAADPAQSGGESFDQKCGRWADYQNLKDTPRLEYVTDCVRELQHPDKAEGGADE